jgi:hemoglobin/transferrin/lactoferrin receptor protein
LPAQAQEAVELGKTVVIATKTERLIQDVPASISVITSEEIERMCATSVADLLRDVPGVEILLNSSPASQRVMIRGEESQRTLILIDGQKVSENKSMDGAPMLIDPNMIERIEIIKGPASVLYGSEAIGGVVNIITKKAGTKPIQVTLSETYNSSTEGWQGFGSVFGLYKGFGYRVSAIYSDQGDLHTPDGTLDNTSFDTKELNAYLDYSWEKGKVGVSYDKYTSDINSHTPEDIVEPPMTYFQLDLPEWDRKKYAGFIELTDISEFLVKARADVYYQETFKEFHQDMEMQIPDVPFPL